ncbi:ATP-grasp ribosomal peptide maturase [Actinopolymorpha alba]|uniref:ATP-grasp ribosomal peptide maturase n=1 Tax=Actinopolymorpha alba TaxID=533267 RepID=UPI00037389C9|nr:ATP-grasp ribosomal peptide maturase [Actinopolymorpha alba]
MTDYRPVLVVTCLDDPTADLVITELNRRRVAVARFDTADLPASLTVTATVGAGQEIQGTLSTPTRTVTLSAVRSVYWRRPGGYRFDHLDAQDARFVEAEARHGLTGTLTSLGCLYVNHPFRVRDADYKPAQLTVAVGVGFTVPATLITNDPDEARRFASTNAPVVYKPLRGSAYQVVDVPRTIWVDEVAPESLDEGIAGTMHLLQVKVDKHADIRVTVVGDRVFCVRINSKHLDWRYDYDTHTYTAVDPPPGIEPALHAYLEHFGLTVGCFDFALATSGEWVFLECNPNGQWAWMETPTGLPMTAAFADLLERGHR